MDGKRDERMERDFARLFRERLGKVCEDIVELCSIAGLDERVAPTVITSEAIRLAAMMVIRVDNMPASEFVKLCGYIYEVEQQRRRYREKRKKEESQS